MLVEHHPIATHEQIQNTYIHSHIDFEYTYIDSIYIHHISSYHCISFHAVKVRIKKPTNNGKQVLKLPLKHIKTQLLWILGESKWVVQQHSIANHVLGLSKEMDNNRAVVLTEIGGNRFQLVFKE